MDFLDPQKERRARLILFMGYALMALVIGIASLVLLYWSYGYSVDREGDVSQNGLVFVSSQPQGATITLNGRSEKEQTNSKLNLKAGDYFVRLSRTGYLYWERPISVAGGDVQRFDYPQLFPSSLKPTAIAQLATQPMVTTHSPDKRWLLTMETAKPGTFLMQDLRNARKPVSSELVIPVAVYTPAEGAHTWSAVEWSTDNRHLLLQHSYQAETGSAREYVMLDRSDATKSVNLTRSLALLPVEQLSLFDKKPDQFYAYNTEMKTLRSFTASEALGIQLTNVRAFKSYGDDTILYVTDTPPNGKPVPGKLSVVFTQGARTVVLRQLSDTGTTFLLDVAEYDQDWYVVAGSNAERGVYVFRNPQVRSETARSLTATPWRFLRVPNATYVAFSSNTRFILAQNAQQVAVYDAEEIETYNYSLERPLDAPQTHVVWKDGHRLAYVSGGKLVVADYDNRNVQVLQAASPLWSPYFSRDDRTGFTVVADPAGSARLTSTYYLIEE